MSYQEARQKYAARHVDTEAAIEKLKTVPVSLHCWQGDDVRGFENAGALTGGIQTTGNYPGAATTPDQLMADIDKAFSLIPGKHNVNVHACYGIYPDGKISDRDAIETSKRLAKEEGLMCGISSGTNVAAALKLAAKLGPGKTVLTILPDTAERYFSTPLFGE